MRLKLMIMLIIIYLSIGDISVNNSTTFRSSVDGYHGFYRVFNVATGELVSDQNNNTFNISVGDNIIWVNEDQTDRITIISDQGLWENDTALLEHTGSQFNYTFNNSGTYTFSTEYKAFPKQIVIVSDNNETEDQNLNITPTINQTEIIMNVTPTINSNETMNVTPTINLTETMNETPTINPTETATPIIPNENAISINPILMPLNIVSNIKMTGFMSFIIIMIIFFIKD